VLVEWQARERSVSKYPGKGHRINRIRGSRHHRKHPERGQVNFPGDHTIQEEPHEENLGKKRGLYWLGGNTNLAGPSSEEKNERLGFKKRRDSTLKKRKDTLKPRASTPKRTDETKKRNHQI